MQLRTLLILSLFFLASGCTKHNNVVINNNTYNYDATPAYVVLGLHDLEFINGFTSLTDLGITIKYMDSAQQTVSLSLSEPPAGISVDSNWIRSGVPTYKTNLRFRSTTPTMPPGSYPMTLTATNASGQQKTFNFNINVRPIPGHLMGKYTDCRIYCSGTTEYTDSLYLDATEPNKIWIANFRNMGNPVYGYLDYGELIIPEQVSGTTTYSYSTGSFSLGLRHINMSFSSSCAMDME